MTEDIVNLNESQRFLVEDPDSIAVIMVDQVTILPVTNQIVYSGFSFDVDYERWTSQKDERFKW